MIHVDEVTDAVARLCVEANSILPDDVMAALKKAVEIEESELGKNILEEIIDNDTIACSEGVPMCQDTGMTTVFIELGQDAEIVGGSLIDAVNRGVSRGYREGYLRKSVDKEPLFDRVNTGDNTPAIIHVDVVPGDKLHIEVAPKGAGSENMCGLKMLKPADGVEGLKRFVLDTVKNAGGNPCPPIIVGVGVGGNFEKVALMAKKALLRPIGSRNKDSRYAALEEELLKMINDMGIGPQGLGGRVTALDVHIDYMPAHIASLPVACAIQCHAARYREVTLG
ncbi:MAG: fumarate hydratase [Thermoanaerobacteraceae bacterium]|nr:fumarate hydratase [Thermoanaerobacteraceae bacterium]